MCVRSQLLDSIGGSDTQLGDIIDENESRMQPLMMSSELSRAISRRRRKNNVRSRKIEQRSRKRNLELLLDRFSLPLWPPFFRECPIPFECNLHVSLCRRLS